MCSYCKEKNSSYIIDTSKALLPISGAYLQKQCSPACCHYNLCFSVHWNKLSEKGMVESILSIRITFHILSFRKLPSTSQGILRTRRLHSIWTQINNGKSNIKFLGRQLKRHLTSNLLQIQGGSCWFTGITFRETSRIVFYHIWGWWSRHHLSQGVTGKAILGRWYLDWEKSKEWRRNQTCEEEEKHSR